MKIKLRVDVFESLQSEKKWSDSELASRMGISRSRLWRAKLSEDHAEYCTPGQSFITGALRAFPNKKFDDLFFLDDLCNGLHNHPSKVVNAGGDK